MIVTPVPFEPARFWVSSESRPINHLVDLDWRDEKWSKPKGMCSCEQMFCKEKTICKHLIEVANYLNHEATQTNPTPVQT